MSSEERGQALLDERPNIVNALNDQKTLADSLKVVSEGPITILSMLRAYPLTV